MLRKLQALVEEGWVRGNPHPNLPLTIYNYSIECQMKNHWTNETLMCRGLVVDNEGKIVARPFKKFFNYEEHYGPLPTGPYEVWKKYDGSLGIVFWYEGAWHVASRKSFGSDVVKDAQRLLQEQYAGYEDKLDKEYTYLFEIISKAARVVIAYPREELRLLAAIHTEGGWEQPPDSSLGFPVAECLAVLGEKDNPIDLKLLASKDEEGFVLRYLGSGLRLKIKFDDYFEMHRKITYTNVHTLWAALQKNNLEQYLENVPDEFYGWVVDVRERLTKQYNDILNEALAEFKARPDTASRTEMFAYFTTCNQRKLVSLMYDGKPYEEQIWKQIRPVGDEAYFGGRMFLDA